MTKIQTLYHEKDIRFLLHEPIVWKFRDFKVNQADKQNFESLFVPGRVLLTFYVRCVFRTLALI